ncbi:MAG: sensor histidine kinase [Anaerolineae bacterium]
MTTWTVLGQFFHGLAFFVLSLTVVFLQYRSRRILLARRLSWLGIFALCEAAVAWNDLLAPNLNRESLLPLFIRTAILGFGYAYLLAFGIQTFLPEDTARTRTRIILATTHLVWVVLFGVVIVLSEAPMARAASTAEVLIRYTLALPGGLLTGIGIRRQSYETLTPEWRGRIRSYLRFIEASAASFGALNFLIVPAAPFFPASLINKGWSPVSPHLLWALVGLFWMLGLALALTRVQREIEQWIESVERVQALSADRERISRELHDGIIQSIYAAGLMLEGVQHYISTDPTKAQSQLRRILDSLNQTIQDIRRYIFDLRSDMPDDDLESGIRRLLRDFHINTLLETMLNVDGDTPHPLTMERRRHVFQIVREALTNTARHAHAQQVRIDLEYGPDALDLVIADDGVGMERLLLSKGYGLRNIRERTRLLDGKLKIDSAPNEGVRLHLTVPY